MIKFWYDEYSLAPKESLSALAGKNVRHGALLKMQWPDKKIGYADLMPWPELGDANLTTHLQELGLGHITSLVEQSIWMARKDAVLRAATRNSLQESPKVKNHYLVSDFTTCSDSTLNSVKSSGFSTLKVKVGRDWTEEMRWITKVLRQYSLGLRLDFNSQGNFATLERMMSLLPGSLRQKIEYIEDPFPFDAPSWAEANKLVPLAVDLEYDNVPWKTLKDPVPFKILVIKPARLDVENAVKHAELFKLKVVVTSNMDHPLGVAHAVRVAGDLKSRLGTNLLECGCLTTRLYSPNEFSSKMTMQGPYLTKIPGTGVGFDDILQKRPWLSLQINAVRR